MKPRQTESLNKETKRAGNKSFLATWTAYLFFSGVILSFMVVGAIAQTNEPSTTPTLHMIGASSVSDKPVIPANPERGWGQMLPIYFKDSLRVKNHAQNGRSTKSFIAEGRWDKVLATLKPGDFVTAPFGDYAANLRRFVREAREHKATPILSTPQPRRKFDGNGKLIDTHGDYLKAMRAVAAELKVPLLDLCAAMEKLLQQLGPESSKRLFDWIPAGEFAPDSKKLEDDTHFNAYGASRVCAFESQFQEYQTHHARIGEMIRNQNNLFRRRREESFFERYMTGQTTRYLVAYN
jgi:lysophospholipase L1-like esterase